MKVELGGLSDINEVKILICWLLNKINKPVSLNNLTDAVLYDGYVNYFDFAIALSDLCASGHVERFIVDNASQLQITQLGLNTAELLSNSLPISVKDKVYAALIAANSVGNNTCSIEQTDDGCYELNMCAKNANKNLFQIKITVSDKSTADKIQFNFLSSPYDFYFAFINLVK